MENKKRLEIVIYQLIELQWNCKGMLDNKTKFDVYEEMIRQAKKLQLLEK